MQKTCTEIIDETVAAYNANNRASDGGGRCYYIHYSTGAMCAVGRCCEAPQSEWFGAWTSLRANALQHSEPFTSSQREALLKPEYRGHSAFFWLELQELHDEDRHWNESGLTESGQAYVAAMRKKWSEPK